MCCRNLRYQGAGAKQAQRFGNEAPKEFLWIDKVIQSEILLSQAHNVCGRSSEWRCLLKSFEVV